MRMEKWHNPKDTLPAEGIVVLAMRSSGDVVMLKYKAGLWFLPDWSMYVYYTPMFWRHIEVYD
jgi:hypothetical protein